jgi:hypothetical protein
MQMKAMKSDLCVDLWQIFFVLRKKNDQITTLHVVHHGAMPVGCWFGMKFVAGNVTYLQCAFDSSRCNANMRVDSSEVHTRYLNLHCAFGSSTCNASESVDWR